MKHSLIAFLRDYWVLLLITGLGVAVGVWFLQPIIRFYELLIDRDTVIAYIDAWGPAAPGVFILIQVLQVVFAPVPGEISGFIGGYFFGSVLGFCYSSIGLTIGSVVNFGIGRLLGYRFVRKLIPEDHLIRMDHFLVRQGLFITLVFYVVPGFPKDYLSLLLGATAMPFRIFIFLAAFGRMPGTLMLSIQGAFLFEQKYLLMGAVLLASILLLAVAYRYRNVLYEWAGSQDQR